MENSLKLTALAALAGATVSFLKPTTGDGDFHFYEKISEKLWNGDALPPTIPIPVGISHPGRNDSPTWLFYNDLDYTSDHRTLHSASVTSFCKYDQ